MIEDDDLEKLDGALRPTSAVDAKRVNLRGRPLSPRSGSRPLPDTDPDQLAGDDAAVDAEDQRPAPHAAASAYRLLAASLSAGATRDRLLKKAAEFEAEARAAASIQA
jgi:hypothetical protein